VTSGEVASESPQQQAPPLQTASTTCPDFSVLEQSVHEQVVPEHVFDHIESLSFIEHISEPKVSDMEVEPSNSSSTEILTAAPYKPLETNTQTAIPTNDQPSTSNLAIQPCAPGKTNVPSPPTLFLDSTILADVCQNIFQELNKLIEARNDLIHEVSYEKQWKRLKERVDFVLSEL